MQNISSGTGCLVAAVACVLFTVMLGYTMGIRLGRSRPRLSKVLGGLAVLLFAGGPLCVLATLTHILHALAILVAWLLASGFACGSVAYGNWRSKGRSRLSACLSSAYLVGYGTLISGAVYLARRYVPDATGDLADLHYKQAFVFGICACCYQCLGLVVYILSRKAKSLLSSSARLACGQPASAGAPVQSGTTETPVCTITKNASCASPGR